MTGTATKGAFVGRAFQHARPNPLARHFHQAEMRDAAHLDACAVVLERVLETALDRAVVALLIHVDEVDHDEAGEVAQPQLPGNLVGSFQIGLEGGVLDMVLAGRATGVDVD